MLIYKIISLLRYKADIAVDSFCWVDLFGLSLSFWAKDDFHAVIARYGCLIGIDNAKSTFTDLTAVREGC